MREKLYNLPPSRALRVPPPSQREEYEDCGYAANLNLNKNFQKKQGHFPYSENALSFCIYNLFCCTSGADCALNPNARYSAREIADNPIPVRVCGFAENGAPTATVCNTAPSAVEIRYKFPSDAPKTKVSPSKTGVLSTVCALPIYGAVPTNALPTGVSHRILCAANRQKRQKARAHSRCFFLNIY